MFKTKNTGKALSISALSDFQIANVRLATAMPSINSTLEKMIKQITKNDDFSKIKISNLSGEIFVDNVDLSIMLGDYESIGQLIKRYVKNNLARKLTLNELARNLHCSTVTLTEHFKREFGITINEYITKKRMDLAEKILLSTDKPLREIATLTGFADVEYFSRTFKKHHGISPASWRREKGKKQDDNTKNTLL